MRLGRDGAVGMGNRLGVTSHQTGLRGRRRNSPEEQQVKCRAVSCWAQPGLLQTQLPERDGRVPSMG